MAIETIRIRVVNWEKHNPGRNGKKMPWFRMSTGYLNDPKMVCLSPVSKHVFIGLLCLCSEKGLDTLSLPINNLKRTFRIPGTNLLSTLNKLQDNLLIQLNENIEEKFYQSHRQDKTREDKIRQDKSTAEEGTKSGDLLILLWNETPDLPKVKTISAHHRRLAREAFKELPEIESWRSIFTKIVKTPFLRGESKAGWRADLTWLLKDGNWARVRDGAFDDAKIASMEKKRADDADYVRMKKEIGLG